MVNIVHKFILTTKHDNGIIEIVTHATSEAAAREAVMIAERCPARSIRRVRAVDEHGFEMLPNHPTTRRVISPPAANVRISEPPGYRVSALKIPTRYEVRIDGRWRRVFSTRHTGLQYVVHDSLNVVIDLPGDLKCTPNS
jgi:hypothetical protein